MTGVARTWCPALAGPVVASSFSRTYMPVRRPFSASVRTPERHVGATDCVAGRCESLVASVFLTGVALKVASRTVARVMSEARS
jgi:hypothetical protein